ncbi:probable G-protein coupled receptor No18 isoform X2 [Actinia tenebrosa]|nr:probable G-protein coupled receptor No18 isoform X2 [Actinia tenebrosa]XP_031551703.1 probable G-protein coupled receptor No18 isoform X2 [Actinia tenebrosa]XP_031551704.1 probable G-protein coupled receptor No18 isoform X2 [Actinia tenebrosa]XP_031551705.1 probable G-protein coupled receptor No18 isoform X2 [Actinia tenebrosa]XP_031551706.1 probable G-protein coupled receptor No18 isoform X2 [Actinia tenebrosa]XP_031551707.1 probable G-protein coupled receptor No18 isoform X2 [Actinia tene
MKTNSTPSSSTHRVEDFDFTFKLVSTFFLIIIIILTLIGNTFVICAFAMFRKLRSVTNHFVVSLAFTDLLVAVFSMPVWAAYLLTGPEWIYPMWLRKIWACMDILCGVASILHLSFISVERYKCISSPLKYHEIITAFKTRVAIAVIWVFSFTMAMIKFIIWGYPPPAYQLSAFILCFVLPTFVMSCAYILIFKVSRTQAKKMTMTIKGKSKRFCLPKELKAAKTLAVVMGAFLFCWFPFFLINVIFAVCRTCPIVDNKAIMLTKWLHYLNSVLNPIIYSCMTRDFRNAFKKLGLCAVQKVMGRYSQLERGLSLSFTRGRTSSRGLPDVHS